MKELIQRLSNVSDAYDDFISRVINYAKKDPEHITILNNYMFIFNVREVHKKRAEAVSALKEKWAWKK